MDAPSSRLEPSLERLSRLHSRPPGLGAAHRGTLLGLHAIQAKPALQTIAATPLHSPAVGAAAGHSVGRICSVRLGAQDATPDGVSAPQETHLLDRHALGLRQEDPDKGGHHHAEGCKEQEDAPLRPTQHSWSAKLFGHSAKQRGK